MNVNDMFRAIFFDLDNTLVDRDAAFRRYLEGLGRRFPELAAPAARQRLSELDDHGLTSRDRFCAAVVASFPELGMSADAFWDDFGDGLAAAVEPRPGLATLLERLAGRYRLGVISNGRGQRQREKLRRAGLEGLLGDIYISAEVGASKPDRRLFLHALVHSGLAADQVLFVGDDPARDIAGATAAGLRTCWISHGRPYPPGLPGPSMSMPSVEELLAALLDPMEPLAPCET